MDFRAIWSEPINGILKIDFQYQEKFQSSEKYR